MSLNNYRVLVTQTRETVVTVTSETEAEALDKAEDMLLFALLVPHFKDDAGMLVEWDETDLETGLVAEKLPSGKWSDE